MKFHTWTAHNLIGHPIGAVLNLAGLHRWADAVHDYTIPHRLAAAPVSPATDPTVEAFSRLLSDIRLNYSRSPWTQQQGLDGIAHHLWLESLEVQQALNNDDLQHVGEELMDVLQNVITCTHALAAAGGPSLEELLRRASSKLRRRKPWVFDEAATQPESADAENAAYRANKATEETR